MNIPLENSTIDEWSRTIHTNINGIYLCLREVARSMMKYKKGKMVNIASISWFVIKM